jgi:hypothetical protein
MDSEDYKGHAAPAGGDLQATIMKYVQTEAFKVWGSFALFGFVAFMMFSSGDFSFLLTLSSLVSTFSFLMVAVKIETGRTVKGVSLRMMECYILIFMGRLIAIIPFEGYLPFDKSGDWFYQLCEAIGFCLAGSIVFFCRGRYESTYDPTTDTLNHLFLILPALALSLIFHPNLNNFLPSDISWAFALYLESVAVLCQLFMFMKEGQAQPHTSHFLAAQALSKLMSFIFWASSFSELSNPNHYIKAFVGNWVVAMQLVQLLVMGDFIYHYIRCIQKGIPVSQILCSDNV